MQRRSHRPAGVPASESAGPPPGVARESWLSGLLNAEARTGRLKGRSFRLLVWAVLVILAGVAIMGLGDILPRPEGASQAQSPADTAGSGSELSSSGGQGGGSTSQAASGVPGVWISVAELEAAMERSLERILSQIKGAGNVSVAVSLESGATYIYGYDETQTSQTTQEKDASGGTRVVTETQSTRQAVVVSQGTAGQALIVRIELPKIQGVVVVAPGAGDSHVKALLSQAVQTLYGVPAHRVVVIAGG
ncbi:MAG: hypothetical protein C4551_01160 [Bacillota bacterium]|nr:MAG: hypothetical protein C4551_01160 [Bacillota bacterium]